MFISVTAFRRALLASLALHGVAFAWVPAPEVAPPVAEVMSVRLVETQPTEPPKPEPQPEPPKPKPRLEPKPPAPPRLKPTPANTASALAGGAALSDPELEASSAPAASALVPAVLQAAAGAHAAIPLAQSRGAPSASESAAMGVRETAVPHAPAPARMQVARNGNGTAIPSARMAVASQVLSAEATASVRGRGGLPAASASALQTAGAAGTGVAHAVSASPQAGAVTSTTAAAAVRRGLAETSPTTRMGSSTVAGPVAKRGELARGGLSSADADALAHAGPEVLTTGLLTVGVGGALGMEAMANAPSSGVFKAALGRDGQSCFKPPPKQWQAEGRVVLQVAVGRDGKPSEVTIVESSGLPRLDELARSQAANCAHFVVQNRRGEALAKTLRLPILYRIKNPW